MTPTPVLPAVLEEVARDMLEANPAPAREWRECFEEPAFAAGPRARPLWQCRCTPCWNETVGLLPQARARVVPAEPRRQRPSRTDGDDGGTATTGR